MTIRLDYLAYIIITLFLISVLAFTHELNGLQKFRLEVERDRLNREVEILKLTKAAADIGNEVDRLRIIGTAITERGCYEI